MKMKSLIAVTLLGLIASPVFADTVVGVPIIGAPSNPVANESCNPSIARSGNNNNYLALINAARATARSCGGSVVYEAAPALRWKSTLERAAKSHSNDMALNNIFRHVGSDGTTLKDRVKREGDNYLPAIIGENIFAGSRTAEDAINAWLNSPAHCKNIMNPIYTEVALTCTANSNSDYGQYWTNVLGMAIPR